MSEALESVAGALVAELEAGAELVDAGGFSIDAVRAREKLRAFALGEPHMYVLLLVEAAVLAGAPSVRITTGEALTVELGPLELRAGELERLFAAAFVELSKVEGAERVRRRIQQKLALACNAALSLEPRAIEIEVVDDRELRRARITPEQERIVVEARPREPADQPGARVRVVAHGSDMGARESDLLRRHCRFSAFEIIVDDERISLGHAFALHVELDPDRPSFTSNGRKIRPLMLDDERIGLVGFRNASKDPAEAVILTNGVLAERIELGSSLQPESSWQPAPGFVALVELDLPKDLGHTHVLRGHEFDGVMAAIRAAHDRIAPAPAPSSEALDVLLPQKLAKAKREARIQTAMVSLGVGWVLTAIATVLVGGGFAKVFWILTAGAAFVLPFILMVAKQRTNG